MDASPSKRPQSPIPPKMGEAGPGPGSTCVDLSSAEGRKRERGKRERENSAPLLLNPCERKGQKSAMLCQVLQGVSSCNSSSHLHGHLSPLGKVSHWEWPWRHDDQVQFLRSRCESLWNERTKDRKDTSAETISQSLDSQDHSCHMARSVSHVAMYASLILSGVHVSIDVVVI